MVLIKLNWGQFSLNIHAMGKENCYLFMGTVLPVVVSYLFCIRNRKTETSEIPKSFPHMVIPAVIISQPQKHIKEPSCWFIQIAILFFPRNFLL